MVQSNDDELEQIRAARRQQIHQQLEEQAQAQMDAEMAAEAASQRQTALDLAMKSVLTPDARSRLATLSLVDTETADKVKAHLAELAETSRIAIPVDDPTLKRILLSLNSEKRETSIRRM